MKRPITVACALALGASYFMLSALPASSADSGAVSAKVTVASPCITITDSLDFGVKAFSKTWAPPDSAFGTSSSYANCSAGSENVSFRGTDAKSQTSSATWTLVGYTPNCGTNQYLLTVAKQGASSGDYALKTDQPLETAAAGATRTLNLGLVMPCTGSSGAGETMTLQYIFTAAL
jgi:hypothetical protein